MCRVLVWLFAIAYLAAAVLCGIGTFGLFGVSQDPLSCVYLIPLGMPWNGMIDLVPEPAWPWLGLLAPAVNLVLLILLCRLIRQRRG